MDLNGPDKITSSAHPNIAGVCLMPEVQQVPVSRRPVTAAVAHLVFNDLMPVR